MKRVFIGLIVIAIGALMLLSNMGIVSLDWIRQLEWKLYIAPALIVFVGLVIIFGKGKKCCGSSDSDDHMFEKAAAEAMDENGFVKMESFLSGQKCNLSGETFTGARLTSFLGGVSLDLREAEINDGAFIKVSALVGGAEIYVPRDVTVKVSSACFCGGVKNVKPLNSQTSNKVLLVRAECMFGGVDIKY